MLFSIDPFWVLSSVLLYRWVKHPNHPRRSIHRHPLHRLRRHSSHLPLILPSKCSIALEGLLELEGQ